MSEMYDAEELLGDYAEPEQEDETEDDADDMAELHALLAEATAASAADKQLKQARQRLRAIARKAHPAKEGEQAQLVAEIHELEQKRIWMTVGCVALFKTQTCTACSSKHSTFQGWMTEQTHASDPSARRLIAGRPAERMPERREDHTEQVACCSDCIECVIAINSVTDWSQE